MVWVSYVGFYPLGSIAVNKYFGIWAPTIALALGMAVGAQAQDITINRDGPADAFRGPSYSPYAGRAFPTKLLWGDTHLHTNLSLDARAVFLSRSKVSISTMLLLTTMPASAITPMPAMTIPKG